MRIAGVDGSTKLTGISIMNDGKLEFHMLIDFHKEKDVMERIKKMLLQICEVLDQYDIDAVYMEKSIDKRNADTMQKLSNLAGGMMLYCAQRNIEFVHPFPSEWRAKIGIKQSKDIKRSMLKEEAIIAVRNEYGLNLGDDEAEAILLSRSAFDLPKVQLSEQDLIDAGLV